MIQIDIDMPKSCAECKFSYADVCPLQNKSVVVSVINKVRDRDCPLENEYNREDCISRQAVLSMQYRIDDSATLSTRDVVNVDDIEDLPSVTPQQKKLYKN